MKDLDLDDITFTSTQTDFKPEEFDRKIHSMNTSQFINTKFNKLKTYNLDFVIPHSSNKNLKPMERCQSAKNFSRKSNLNFKVIKQNFKGIEEIKQLEEIEEILKDLQSDKSKTSDQKPRFR